MSKQKVGIITECVCDLPQYILKQYDIRIIYFLVKTNHGSFYDSAEITARNVFEYMQEQGDVPISSEPAPEVYRKLYEEALEKYDELIHIAISSQTSNSYFAAEKSLEEMGDDGRRVHIFDSGHLSTGQGHLIILAADLASAGASADEILEKLNERRDKVSSSFVVDNVNYLYRNGRLSASVKKICDRFSLHPVLAMKKGKLELDGILIGNYDKVCKKYVKKILKKEKAVNSERIFLTHAGCSVKRLEKIKTEIGRYCKPQELIVTEASATVSSNCGPNTFGILFYRD